MKEPSIVPGLIGQIFDQIPNVFGPPSGASGRQLNRFREAPRFHSFPPTGFAEGYNAKDLRQA
jgi:hypothetical protein